MNHTLGRQDDESCSQTLINPDCGAVFATREPHDDQIEVAIKALEAAKPQEHTENKQ